MKRRLVTSLVLFGLAACIASGLLVPAAGIAKATPINFRFTATPIVAQTGGTAGGQSVRTDPFEDTLPHLGRATVSVLWSRSINFACGPPPCFLSTSGRLTVDVVARGGTLVLEGTTGLLSFPPGGALPGGRHQEGNVGSGGRCWPVRGLHGVGHVDDQPCPGHRHRPSGR
jgi:hypothetical protein